MSRPLPAPASSFAAGAGLGAPPPARDDRFAEPIVADYRASAGVEIAQDRADRLAGHTLRMPVGVLQQDWGAAPGFDAALWRAWAPDLRHTTVRCGHFMAEDAPDDVAQALRELFTR